MVASAGAWACTLSLSSFTVASVSSLLSLFSTTGRAAATAKSARKTKAVFENVMEDYWLTKEIGRAHV